MSASGEGRHLGRAAASVAVAAVLLSASSRVDAVEAFDGRLQLHGFAESQVRALSRSFSEELDLAQWYNVLNLEFEVDLAPNGLGPFDLLQAYARVEGRYDCVYSRGCGMFRSVNTYGDRAERLPGRLSDALAPDYGGVIRVDDPIKRIRDQKPVPLATSNLEEHVDENGNFERVEDFREGRGYPGFSTLFRQAGADNLIGTDDDPGRYTMASVLDYRFALPEIRGPDGGAGETLTLGPWLPKQFIQANALLTDRANPFRGRNAAASNNVRRHSLEKNAAGNPFPNSDPFPEALLALTFDGMPLVREIATAPGFNAVIPVMGNPRAVLAPGTVLPTVTRRSIFGGDFSGIIPCEVPGSGAAANQIAGTQFSDGCLPGGPRVGGGSFPNIRTQGGVAELPLRPAPDRSNRDTSANPTFAAQGLFVPSRSLRALLQTGDLDNLDFNFRQAERAWNRGQSQQDTKELKEAYFDIEMFDSRLWARLGLQNIVWGKTELFRTTDQFNPQDLALASLPSLEESRIALWAARFVYSLYDVGPINDLRLEFAFNFDQFQPADLGACGEAFTPDVVCTLTNGIFAHSFAGVAVAGIDRPENPWQDLGGVEVGGRIEWRWDRFSFAVVDFWGFNDFPFTDVITQFDRNVDPMSGRPRILGATGACANAPITDPKNILVYSSLFGFPGIGSDPDCLKAGAAAGGLNANGRNGAGTSPQNALENHPSNQQFFAWVCSTTVSILSLDPGACAWTLFNSSGPLFGAAIPQALTEVFSVLFAGEPSLEGEALRRTVLSTRSGFSGSSILTPVRPLNIDAQDGINLTSAFPTLLTMDSTLTNEQRALLGCGPFYGTRCDSSRAEGGFPRFGGVDVLNMEASALLQSWPGLEGTEIGWKTTSTQAQPGTIDFDGGPACTRFVDGELVTLPGCRGVSEVLDLDEFPGIIPVVFDQGYDPLVDGCVFGETVGGRNVMAVNPDGTMNAAMNAAIQTCFDDSRSRPFTGVNADSIPPIITPAVMTVNGATTLFHPLAGCVASDVLRTVGEFDEDCREWANRDFEQEYLDGISQVFRSEMAGYSFNFLMFLTFTSCDDTSPDLDDRGTLTPAEGDARILNDPECFNPAAPFDPQKCSFASPQFCTNVKGLFQAAGVLRNDVRAGGNGRFGRRTFLWHGGSEVVLRYEKRNVLGFSMDFAEDITKSNWGMEFTWIEGLPFSDANELDGIRRADSLNLTVSVDRPTFINFLNANRTFFINSQWFFQWVPEYRNSFSSNGPVNVLFTVAVFTGYFQDRLLPNFVAAYDFNSRSGAFLPSLAYRFTEALSVTVGMNLFIGTTQFKDMPLRPIPPPGNRAGADAYDDGVQNVLSVVRHRDEVFLRLRWTF